MNRPALIHPSLMPTILVRDPIRVWRPSATVDSEGDTEGLPTEITSQLASPFGVWGKPTDADVQIAAQRGTVEDAILITQKANDIRDSDIVSVLGNQYDVVAVEQTFTHQRLHLRVTTL